MMERSFVMLKPDAVLRRLMGKVLTKFEERGLKLVAAKMMNISEELAKEHYGEHKENLSLMIL